ncbi:MAG: hypothetical protein NC078_09245 [Ruminococcus sp.]|nr:hypothetical protein [Ruminococcus sp.]
MVIRRKKVPGEAYVSPKPSGWYYADMAVAVGTVLWQWFTFTAMIFRAVAYVPFIALGAGMIVHSRKEYYADKLSTPWRIVTGTIRAGLYALALFSCSLIFIMGADEPALYPLQKAVYMKNYREPENIFLFLPDNIPLDAKNYKAQFTPAFLQGSAFIRIEFFTESTQLNKYRDFAKKCGAVKTSAHDSWAEYIAGTAGITETPEEWQFPVKGGYHAYYYIWPESGYFMILW